MFGFLNINSLISFFNSGLLLDFFFKNFVYQLLHIVFLVCCMFLEKFFVEHIFLSLNNYINLFYNYSEYFMNESFFSNFSVIILILIIIIFVTC